MKNIKLKLLKKYNEYSNNQEVKAILKNAQSEINKLNYLDNEINIVYLGGACLNKFSMIFGVINTYNRLINYLDINFSVSILNSKTTNVKLKLEPDDLGILNYKEGVLLQLNVPIEGIYQEKSMVSNDQVFINVKNIIGTYKED